VIASCELGAASMRSQQRFASCQAIPEAPLDGQG
jgi:hypothetical protein